MGRPAKSGTIGGFLTIPPRNSFGFNAGELRLEWVKTEKKFFARTINKDLENKYRIFLGKQVDALYARLYQELKRREKNGLERFVGEILIAGSCYKIRDTIKEPERAHLHFMIDGMLAETIAHVITYYWKDKFGYLNDDGKNKAPIVQYEKLENLKCIKEFKSTDWIWTKEKLDDYITSQAHVNKTKIRRLKRG